MTEREKLLMALIYLMQLEARCLRSVLSECGVDHSGFTQWVQAQIYRDAIDSLEVKV